MSRDGGVIYKSQVRAIQRFDAETQVAIYNAFFDYLFDGEEPTENDNAIVLSLMDVFKPQIDANNKRYENGKKGGRKPKAKEPKAEAQEPVIVEGDLYPQIKKNPYAPTLLDVEEFIMLKNLNVNAEEFFNHYAGTNWYVGGTAITNWKSLCKSWNKKPKQQNNSTGSLFADIYAQEASGTHGN